MSATRCTAQAVFSHLFKAQGHLVAESRLRSADRKVARCVLVHVIVPRAGTQGETVKKPRVETRSEKNACEPPPSPPRAHYPQ